MTASSRSLPSNFTLRRVEIDRDAERLARMWNASDDQWPGTWTGGVPMTAERMRDWFARERHTEVVIWETADAIAGYCSLWERPSEAKVTYIALLNVAPAFQGQGLARRMLTHYVTRSIELGATRLDLDTWSGNLKAVPLYKKCGFFWVPGTSVDMQNYLPAILTLPQARGFFARHDWYTAFQRDLSQAEDDERWQGMKVFVYRFAAGDERLTVWIDREARAMTAIETNDALIAASTATSTPPRGLPTTMHWQVSNTSHRPLPVSLIASGGPDLTIDHRATLTLDPGQSTTLEATVQVAAAASDAAPSKAAPAVRSLLIVAGHPVELATGLRPRPAVAVTTEPAAITLAPGVAQTVLVQLQSGLAIPTSVTVGLTPAPGLTVDWSQQTVAVPAEGHAGLPVTLRATTSGVFALTVALTLALAERTVTLPATTLSIFALEPGGLLGATVDGTLRLENDLIRLTIEREGGRLTLADRHSGERLVEYLGYPTPPTWPSEYRRSTFDLTLERTTSGLLATATVAAREHAQFILRRRVSFGAGAVIRVEHEFENQAATERAFHLHHDLSGDRYAATVTLPLAAGLTSGAWEDFPGEEDAASHQATAYAEGWAAVTFPTTTVGLVWGDEIEEIEGGTTLTTRAYPCPPQSRVVPAPLHLIIDEAGWPAARRLWQRLTGQPTSVAAPPPRPAPPLSVRCEPPVVVAANDTATVRLLVEHRRSRPVQGTLRLRLPDGWSADNDDIALADLTWRQPCQVDLRLTTHAAPGPASGHLLLRTDELDLDLPLTLLRLGDGRPVTVREWTEAGQPVLTIDNGRLSIDVTPAFGGTVSALREGAVDHLASPFPTATTFGWLNPWFGGLTPILLAPGEDDYPGRLRQERFSGAAIEQVDRHGLHWHGARQQAVLQREELRGLTLEIETLTVGGSPIIKQVLRLRNATPVARPLKTVGWWAFVQPDGSHTRTTVWGPAHQIKHSDRITWLRTGAWAAAQNPATGRAIVLVSDRPQAGLSGWGRQGNHLALTTHLTVPANGAAELVGYLALADDLEAARRYAALGEAR